MEKEQLQLISQVFGNELRKIRDIERDVTQEQFAQDTGIGPEHISEIERGKRLPRIDTLLKLRNAGVNINLIFDRIIQELDANGIDLTE
ncbi:helix-turn-helix domain-containing protein [Ornithinibacillus sp. 179-J 7C1 HS]|uniref:helix-turn-helix domain-containing protein n=1 Tax=Ornithinibacillus sp. 179-J 7C1 HS TaxID=3142384 RepID=UPI0039A18A7D